MIEPRPFASTISNKLPYALLVCRPITPDFCNKFCKKNVAKTGFYTIYYDGLLTFFIYVKSLYHNILS